MEIAIYQGTYTNTSLDDVIQSLCDGLQANIPYSPAQVFSLSRVTATIINADNINLYDSNEQSNLDTVGLIMELENGIRSVLQSGYDATLEHGAGVVAVYSL